MVCHMGWYTFGLLAHLLIDVRKVLLSHESLLQIKAPSLTERLLGNAGAPRGYPYSPLFCVRKGVLSICATDTLLS